MFDRNTVLAFFLIGLIMVGWSYFYAPPTPPPIPEELLTDRDSLTAEQDQAENVDQVQQLQAEIEAQTEALNNILASEADTIPAHDIVVENDLYIATLSTKGASLKSFKLKTYTKPDRTTLVEMVDTTILGGALALAFQTPANHDVDTRTLHFIPAFGEQETFDASSDVQELVFETTVNGSALKYIYTFTPASYEVGFRVELENPTLTMTRNGYEVIWDGGIPFAESDPDKELLAAGAFAHQGGDIVKIGVGSDQEASESLNGDIEWVGVKNTFFTAVVIPDTDPDGAEIEGFRTGEKGDSLLNATFTARIYMPRGSAAEHNYRLYLGPMEYNRISAYDLGLYDMVDFGFGGFIARPLAKWIFIPTFGFLKGFIPSFGLIIIIFALGVKGVLYPLTKKSFVSMARMKDVQPQMNEIKEKHGDNPQKQQEAMMRLYREEGVNPLGGCLPMLFQMPILIALWRFIPSAIELRHQAFLWATDLSAPDILFELPFTIPLYGGHVSGFCALMGLAMVVQMKVQGNTGATSNTQAKMMQYFMPIMLFVIFNTFAAGLNLYYLIYNSVSAIQQKFINNSIEKQKANAPAKPVKKVISQKGKKKNKSKKSSR